MNFEDLRKANAERLPLWHPPGTGEWSLADWSNAMQGEAGECGNMIKKLRRIETATGGGKMKHNGYPLSVEQEARILAKGAGLEIADTVIYCDILAQELERRYPGCYSMEELIQIKFNAVSHREGFQVRLG